jgi:hypothetical protein
VQNANLSYLENLSDLQYEYTYSSSTRTVVVHLRKSKNAFVAAAKVIRWVSSSYLIV